MLIQRHKDNVVADVKNTSPRQGVSSQWATEIALIFAFLFTLPIGFLFYYVGGVAAVCAGVFFNLYASIFRSHLSVMVLTALSGAVAQAGYQVMVEWHAGGWFFPVVAAICGAFIAYIKASPKAMDEGEALKSSQRIKNVIHFSVLGPWLGLAVVVIFGLLFNLVVVMFGL